MDREQVQKSKPALQSYEDRAVGCPPAPDLSKLLKKAEKGNKEGLTEIREILRVPHSDPASSEPVPARPPEENTRKHFGSAVAP